MKKTISINLSGLIFYIEEDGFETLQQYLDNIRSQFKDEEEANMILEDVELRIAELFTKELSLNKTAITSEDVEKVIETMGEASAYSMDEEDDEKTEEKTTYKTEFVEVNRKLYRDPENGSIGGVAAGLGAYFNIEVSIIRLIFVILFLAGLSGAFIYIILWIILPKASTTNERLRMAGRPITVDNITKEVNEAGKRFSNSSKAFSKEFKEKIEPRFKTLGNVLSKLFGIAILLFCAFWLTIFLVGTVGNFGIVGSDGAGGLLSIFDLSHLAFETDTTYYFAWTGLILGFICALTSLILLGLMLIFRFKTKTTKRSFLTLTVIFVIAAIICMVVGIQTGINLSSSEKEYKTITTVDNSEIILNYEGYENRYSTMNREDVFKVTEDSIYFPFGNVRILPTEDSVISIEVVTEANGKTSTQAFNRLKNINAQVKVTGSTLNIPEYFSFPYEDKFRNQTADIIIYLPETATAIRKLQNEEIKYSIDMNDYPIHIHRNDYRNRNRFNRY